MNNIVPSRYSYMPINMPELFKQHTDALIQATQKMDQFHQQVTLVVEHLKQAYARGNKVLIAGNGGSAAESQHFSDEMVGRYREDRPAYPAIALTADSAIITCISNDYGYHNVFARQISALGVAGDIFIGLTTSGTSKNILAAAKVAREHSMTVIAMTGPTGKFGALADLSIVSPSNKAAVIQELHLHAIHLICEAFEPKNIKK